MGDATTSQAADQLVGGEGTDTLKLYGNAAAPAHSGIEVVHLDGNTLGFDVSTKTDVTTLELVDPTTAKTYTVAAGQATSVATMANSETIDFAGNTVVTMDLTVNGLGTQAGAGVTVDFNSTAQTTVNVTASTAASHIVLLNTGAKLATVTVAGDKAVTIDAVTNNIAVTSVEASSNTGGVTVKFDDGTDRDVTFTGGTGDDRIDLGAEYESTDTIDGGDGTDTLVIAIADADPTTAQTRVTNMEVLALEDALDNDEVDIAKFGVNKLELVIDSAGAVAAGVLSGMTSGGTLITGTAVDAVGGTNVLDINLSDAAGSGDVINLDINNTTGAGAFNVDVTGVETINIDASGSDQANTVNLTAAQATAITVQAGSGAADNAVVTFTAGGTALASVDASGTTGLGGLNLTLSSSAVVGATVTGTKNADDVVDSAGDDSIDLGAGADIFSYTNGGADTVDLGAAGSVDQVEIDAFATAMGAQITNFVINEDKLDVVADTVDDAINAIASKLASEATLGDNDITVINFSVGSAGSLLTGGSETIADFTDIADVEAFLDEAFAVGADDDALILLTDGTNSYLYRFLEANSTTTMDAAEITLVGTFLNAALDSNDVQLTT